ncbi:MAG: hypothetical protein K0S65_3968, partial [Labilithrix sp.]|nr:hypothetical protein [Labilithrix sp.]
PCAIDLASPASLSETFCALLESGRVACWGGNELSELGRGADAGTEPSGQPAFVEGISGATMLDGRCAVVTEGSVMCWGDGSFLQDEGTSPTPTAVKLPIPPAKKIRTKAGGSNDEVGCALLVSGQVTCWGLGPQGRLDDGTVGNVGTPGPAIVALPTDAPIVDIGAGDARFALRADGVALSWGWWRSLGRASSLPIDLYPMPVTLSGVTDLDVASESVCAVAEGNVYCWGESADEVISTIPARATPERVTGLPDNMVQVSTTRRRLGATYQRACAVSDDGDVYCWGDNQFGQAGDGSRTFAFAPVKVAGLPEPAVMVRAAETSTCALVESGRVFCWGNDTFGSLGRGTLGSFDERPAPVVLP